MFPSTTSFTSLFCLKKNKKSIKFEEEEQKMKNQHVSLFFFFTELFCNSEDHSKRRNNRLYFATSKIAFMLRYIFDSGSRKLVFQNLCVSRSTCL
jgi:hypothetical protein